MSLPFFYIPGMDPNHKEIELNEDSSKHIIQVLRMRTGEMIHLTDGRGHLLTAAISKEHKRHCRVTVDAVKFEEPPGKKIAIGISLVKNAARFEWFLEKATEIGVQEIIPMICARTEKTSFRLDRMQGICTSAMLQSQQVWLPKLSEPVQFMAAVSTGGATQKFIAYCEDSDERTNITAHKINGPVLVLVGPEGDFTREEISLALDNNFIPVTLGANRLRTETAGVVAAALLANLAG